MNNQVSQFNEESFLHIPQLLTLRHHQWSIIGESHLLDFLHTENIVHTQYQQQLDDVDPCSKDDDG